MPDGALAIVSGAYARWGVYWRRGEGMTFREHLGSLEMHTTSREGTRPTPGPTPPPALRASPARPPAELAELRQAIAFTQDRAPGGPGRVLPVRAVIFFFFFFFA